GLLAGVSFSGGQTLEVGGKSISIHSRHNLLHLAYVVLFVRGVWWWRSEGCFWAYQFDGRLRRLLLWHGLPGAVWLLLPKRLGYWLWYLLLNKGENPQHDLAQSIEFYTSSMVTNYHVGIGSALAVAGLAIVAGFTFRRLRRGGRAVLLLLLLGLV